MSDLTELGPREILRLFHLLDAELRKAEVVGELLVVGGAVMCLVHEARPSTRDVDAWFRPTRELREAAARVAALAGVPEGWLNDGVKGFLGDRGEFEPYLELPNLKVSTARADYLLALKAAAMRIGEGFRDEQDLRFLLRAENVETYAQAVEIITRFFEPDQIPQKTWYALEELLQAPTPKK